MLPSHQQNGIGTSEFAPFRKPPYPAYGLPCERFTPALAGNPCITRGRDGWLDLISWRTFTSYLLPAFLAHSARGQVQTLIASIEVSMGMLRAAARSGESNAPVSALMRMIESRDFPAANGRF